MRVPYRFSNSCTSCPVHGAPSGRLLEVRHQITRLAGEGGVEVVLYLDKGRREASGTMAGDEAEDM